MYSVTGTSELNWDWTPYLSLLKYIIARIALASTKAVVSVAALICAGLFLVACSDHIAYDTPYLRTRVIDAATKQPIANANVIVWQPDHSTARASGSSDQAGSAIVESLTHMISTFLPWDSLPPGGRARVEAHGYVSREVEVGAGMADTPPIELAPSN
jgi:hypothetical protein